VEDGVVTLEGEVEWDYQRGSAKNAVASLLGVRDVVNRISVMPRITASDVKSRISSALHRTATIDAERISVDIVGNKAILRGKVRSYAEKEDAEDAAWAAAGISSVDNYLEIVPEEIYTF
jgi:osmotically-inducible protein OsmY